MKKQCNKCNETKPIELFYPNRSKCIRCYQDERSAYQKKVNELKKAEKAKIVITHKVCSICNESKELNCFNKKSKQCKPCRNEKTRLKRQDSEYKKKELEQCKKYRDANKEKISAYHKKHYEANKDKIKKRVKKHREDNIEKYKKQKKEYRLLNKDKIKKQAKIYRKENRDKINEYFRNRRKSDPKYRILRNHRTRLGQCLKKIKSSREYLGCDLEMLMNWIEFQFTEDMNWDNHGSYWHLDHFIPCASFDLSKPDEQEQCFNWTNMQPLEANRNFSKGNKIPEIREILIMELKQKQFELISK